MAQRLPTCRGRIRWNTSTWPEDADSIAGTFGKNAAWIVWCGIQPVIGGDLGCHTYIFPASYIEMGKLAGGTVLSFCRLAAGGPPEPGWSYVRSRKGGGGRGSAPKRLKTKLRAQQQALQFAVELVGKYPEGPAF